NVMTVFIVSLALGFGLKSYAQAVILCTEEQKEAAVKEGVQIVGYSLETDPSNPGMHVQYRRVLRTERVVTGPNGAKPWYYFVYLGPVIPNTNSYVFWPSSEPPPWRNSPYQPPQGPLLYIGVHEHSGCDRIMPYCKKYTNHPVYFDHLGPGKVTGKMGTSGRYFEGTLTGTVLRFTYDAGSPGRATFNFSPDFKTFTGTFEDNAGHRGIWSGTLQQ
ncbi:MAG: hypothetical protein KDC24_15405, partial [Saprospiraceae bacterium]|nr:hypothetical protein [Saprospiraceae bacterium]